MVVDRRYRCFFSWNTGKNSLLSSLLLSMICSRNWKVECLCHFSGMHLCMSVSCKYLTFAEDGCETGGERTESMEAASL